LFPHLPDDEPLPLSADAHAAMQAARANSIELAADQVVGSDFLLLALIQSSKLLQERLGDRGLILHELERLVLTRSQPTLRLEEPLRLDDLTETTDINRILDASANRAREAMRV